MSIRSILASFGGALLVVCVLAGCQSSRPLASSGGALVASTRNNCYSLLHQVLDAQKDVSLLRFIKREEPDVKSLVKRIAANSAAGAKLIEEYARHDPLLNLNDVRLPPGEEATREAIAATKKRELLGQTGAEFELSLLLTQIEALSYAWHLAKVAGENETQPDRARGLAGVSEDMERLYHEVVLLLLSKTKSSATKKPRNEQAWPQGLNPRSGLPPSSCSAWSADARGRTTP